MLRLVERTIFVLLVHAELEVFNLGDETIFLQLHQHLLLNSCLELVAQSRERLTELIILFLLFGLIAGQFGFLLLHATMVDLLKVPLLAQLVIGRPSFLSDNASFIKLLL